MGAKDRAALWAKPDNLGKPAVKPRPGPWSVVKTRGMFCGEVIVTKGVSHEDAERIAGERRDRASDAEVRNGWDYVIRRQANPGPI